MKYIPNYENLTQ